jgi:uncharacterized protein
MLSEGQRVTLLDVARRAVEAQVRAKRPDAEAAAPGCSDASGVFVTLKLRGELRGCLGTLECRGSLEEEVARCAADSASRDPRFPAVREDELPDLALEISVLGPLERCDPALPGAIEVGRHGLVVELGANRGLLLPQVATDWGWTPDQFLRQTCLKARLPEDAWRHGAAVYRFEAEVFGE